MLGYDLGSSYTNRGESAIAAENAHELVPLWEFEARGLVYGTPVVVDGVVYVTSTGGLYAFDDASGELVWQNLEIGATSSLAFVDGTLFVHDLGGFLRSLDAATGEEKWQTRTDAHPLATGLSSPIVFERYVVVGLSSNEIVREGATFRGGVAAFDRETGAQLWRDYTADPPHNGASVWSTVAIDPEARVVFAGSGQNYTGEAGPGSDALFALDLDTGARLWTTQTVMGDVFTPINPRGPDADFGANPILLEAEIGGRMRRLVAAGQKNGMFWALDRETGEVVWQRRLGPGSPLTGGVLNNGAFDGERILVANNDGGAGFGTLFALRPSDGEVLWQRPLPGWVWAPITVGNGVGFVAADKSLYGFDAATGADLFVFATEGTIACGASVAKGRVRFGSGIQHIVGTVNRKLHVLGLPGDNGGMGPGPVATPSGGPTFTAVYEEVFIGAGCNTPLCHGGGAGALAMTTRDGAYRELVGVPAAGELCAGAGARVDPGNPEGSLLLDKVSSRSPLCGDPMPIAAPLAAEQVDQIRRWIEIGAPND
jgi:polyvinyl alcohol dehydrogenase (cytochrome)